jgi:hypothetical protein
MGKLRWHPERLHIYPQSWITRKFDGNDCIARFCDENGYELVKVYEDAGISGAKVDENDMKLSDGKRF